MLLKSLSLSAVLLLCSCVTPPDIYTCTTLDKGLGWCMSVISHKEVYVDDNKNLLNGEKWDDILNGGVVLPISSWEQIKTYVDNSCHQSGKCSNNIGDWQATVQSLDLRVTKKRLK